MPGWEVSRLSGMSEPGVDPLFSRYILYSLVLTWLLWKIQFNRVEFSKARFSHTFSRYSAFDSHSNTLPVKNSGVAACKFRLCMDFPAVLRVVKNAIFKAAGHRIAARTAISCPCLRSYPIEIFRQELRLFLLGPQLVCRFGLIALYKVLPCHVNIG